MLGLLAKNCVKFTRASSRKSSRTFVRSNERATRGTRQVFTRTANIRTLGKGTAVVAFGVGLGVGLTTLSGVIAAWLTPRGSTEEVTWGPRGIWGNASVLCDEKRKTVVKETVAAQPLIWKVVLTGGPCGGKSTALSLITQRLSVFGVQVFLVPEAATLLFTGGGRFKPFNEFDQAEEMAFESSKIKTQLALEEVFTTLAKASGKPSVIVCDRGVIDSKAYVSPETWQLLLDQHGWTVPMLRDKGYDAVIHLKSTAEGAEQFYTTANNPARSESLEEARQLDEKILDAWLGHPRLFIVDNSTDFKGKMNRVVEIMCRIVGVPKPRGAHRKFLVRSPDLLSGAHTTPEDLEIPIDHYTFSSEHTFLLDKNTKGNSCYSFIYKRNQPGSSTYHYSTKHKFADSDEEAIVERQISGYEYAALRKQADPQRLPVKKTSKCFLWKNRYFELNYFEEPNELQGLVVLKTEVNSEEQPVSLPPFLKIGPEVTNDMRFSTYTLASHDRTAD